MTEDNMVKMNTPAIAFLLVLMGCAADQPDAEQDEEQQEYAGEAKSVDEQGVSDADGSETEIEEPDSGEPSTERAVTPAEVFRSKHRAHVPRLPE